MKKCAVVVALLIVGCSLDGRGEVSFEDESTLESGEFVVERFELQISEVAFDEFAGSRERSTPVDERIELPASDSAGPFELFVPTGKQTVTIHSDPTYEGSEEQTHPIVRVQGTDRIDGEDVEFEYATPIDKSHQFVIGRADPSRGDEFIIQSELDGWIEDLKTVHRNCWHDSDCEHDQPDSTNIFDEKIGGSECERSEGTLLDELSCYFDLLPA